MKMFLKKIRMHLDLLSIPQSGGKIFVFAAYDMIPPNLSVLIFFPLRFIVIGTSRKV